MFFQIIHLCYNKPMKRNGFTLTETLIIGTIVGLILIVGSVVLSSERARTRDAKRIADITRLASGFALLFAEKASYAPAAAGCPKVGDPATNCTFSASLTTEAVNDPGSFKYIVSRVPDKDNFGVTFHLEKKYGSLEAGTHTLSKIGVQ